MRKPLLGLVILFLAPALASGQAVNDLHRLWAAPPQSPPSGESEWGNLEQLRVGQKIEVVQTDLKKLKGTFLSFSEEAISLRVGKDELGVQREDVFRVSLRKKSKRLRNALIGMAIGAGAGAALAAAENSRTCGDQPFASCFDLDFGAITYAILVPVGGAVGAGVGAAFPPGYKTIYRAEGKRGGTVP
jgi:hypothetical protein